MVAKNAPEHPLSESFQKSREHGTVIHHFDTVGFLAIKWHKVKEESLLYNTSPLTEPVTVLQSSHPFTDTRAIAETLFPLASSFSLTRGIPLRQYSYRLMVARRSLPVSSRKMSISGL